MTDTELESLAVAYKEARVVVENKEVIAKAIAESIKDELDSRGVDEADVGIFHIAWKQVLQQRFDVLAIKEQEYAKYMQYLKDSLSRPFRVTA
jgi:hypothetical protein